MSGVTRVAPPCALSVALVTSVRHDECHSLASLRAGPAACPAGGVVISEVPAVRGKRPPEGEPVIDRALRLLASFDATHRTLSLSDLARRSQLPASTALRLAKRLQEWGALERDEHGSFAIGLRLYEIASLAPRGLGLREAALPYMGDLAEATRQHVLLAVREDDEAVLVERLSGHAATKVLYRVGGRLPLHSTGVGLVLLAHAPADVQEDYLARPLVHEPERLPVSATELRRTLADVRRDRSVTWHRQVPAPVTAVASPVFGADDTVVAALSVVQPEAGIDPRRLVPALQTASRAISRALGAQRAVGAPARPRGSA